MAEDKDKLHRMFAVDCFNGTWDLLDKTDRTPEEAEMMIHMSHASRYHWGIIGNPLNFARGDWQISRVYVTLKLGKPALKYGESSLQHCLDNGFGDFDLAFGYEAIARAYAVLGDDQNLAKYKELATEAGKAIVKDGDRDFFFGELDTI